LKRKYWLIFGVIQAVGTMGVFNAVFLQFPSLVLVPLLLLLPGSLAAIALSWRANVGANWSPWTLGAIAVLVNVFLFTITSFLLTRYRKSKSVTTEA
jgi:membrane protein YdbS with pleckstrin-like domain